MNNTGTAAGAGMGGFFLGMLAGAVAAGVAVLLLAPRSGKETRDILVGKATETRDMLKSQINDVREKMSPRSTTTG